MWFESLKSFTIALTRASSSSDPMTRLVVSVSISFVRMWLKKVEYVSKSLLSCTQRGIEVWRFPCNISDKPVLFEACCGYMHVAQVERLVLTQRGLTITATANIFKVCNLFIGIIIKQGALHWSLIIELPQVTIVCQFQQYEPLWFFSADCLSRVIASVSFLVILLFVINLLHVDLSTQFVMLCLLHTSCGLCFCKRLDAFCITVDPVRMQSLLRLELSCRPKPGSNPKYSTIALLSL